VWVKTLVAGVVIVVLAGCAEGGGARPASDGTSGVLRSCGDLPASTGPAASLVTLRLDPPEPATVGSMIAVTASIDVQRGGPRIITRPQGSRIVVAQGTSVVGGASVPRGTHDVPVVLTAGATRPVQALPPQVVLSRCPGPEADAKAPLPAGTYSLVAVLAYGQDPLQNAAGGGSRTFQLVSEPVELVIH
jgi:hypothetical protein